jgi:hypothetical protein
MRTVRSGYCTTSKLSDQPSAGSDPTPAALVWLSDVHAYPENRTDLLTQPANPRLGVTTSDDHGNW